MKWATIIGSFAAYAGFASAAAIERSAPDSNLGKRGSTCNSPHIAGLYFIGGQGGGPFCETKWPGPITLQRLTTWSNGNDITGIEVQYTDSTTNRWGQGFNSQNSGQIIFAAGEFVTSAWLAGNGKGTRLGKIHLETNKQTQDLGKSDSSKIYSPASIGSGLLVGVTGNAGDAIDNLALMFVQPKITGIDIGAIQFNQDDMNATPNSQVAFSEKTHYYNPGPTGNQTFSFSAMANVQHSHAYTQTTTGSIGMDYSVSVKVGVPDVAEVTAGTTLKWDVSHSTSSTVTDTSTYQAGPQTQAGSLAPKTGVDCTAVIYSGSGTIRYTSTVSLNFDDGSSYTYQEPGQLSSTQNTDIYMSCTPNNVATAPDGFKQGNLN